MGNENVNDIRYQTIELLRQELPVLRAKARVSQGEVANIIGISRQTYSLFESGSRQMPWTTFLALVAYFQNNTSTKDMICNIDGLFAGIEIIVDPSKGLNNNGNTECNYG